MPLYIGSLISEGDKQILLDIIKENKALLIVSSDFCHYGARFGYNPMIENKDANEVDDYVNNEVIEGLLKSKEAFILKMDQTQNTVCGRYTIAAALDIYNHDYEAQVLSYTRSSKLKGYHDSNVSYVGIIAI